MVTSTRTVARLSAVVVAGWSVLWFAVLIGRGGGSWHYFVQGAQLLADLDDAVRGGLHVYAAAPVLQIGPVALVAALAAMPLGAGGALLAWQILGALAGVLVLLEIRRIARLVRPFQDRQLLDLKVTSVAIFVVPVWMFLAVGAAHLDDELALLFAVFAVRRALLGRAVSAGLLLGLAVDAKPWAVPFACLLLLLGRPRLVAVGAAVMAAIVAVGWLPFFLADPGTSNAVHFTIVNTPLSALRVLGVDDPRTPPWVRPAQAVLGTGLALMAFRRRRWPAIVLVAVAARLVLDPGTNKYYVAGLVVGAALWDVVGSRRLLPWWTGLACLTQFSARWVPMPDSAHGWLTLLYFLGCCVLAVNRGAGWPPRTAAPPWRRAASHRSHRSASAPPGTPG
ncbi:hypothetical protein DFJ67_6888 [Asanoa ferruginea]|uniref:Alpha-1,2-mannosyltransferase n=1 Tax=Asanoa ferruginea TaxID=53367 RepID=A0A3E0A3C5_9ACTN|nr:hypothetical protein [Asanoa ferruginea]REG00831.1 hypothetical protein DFJ67_6888 [Asanoa ferruginea]GIF47294.1 hypothetical protein Afe04nite_18330 [Asanoa ferruginea]